MIVSTYLAPSKMFSELRGMVNSAQWIRCELLTKLTAKSFRNCSSSLYTMIGIIALTQFEFLTLGLGRTMKVRNQQMGRNPTLLVWAFLFLYPLNAFADSPTVQIKSTVDQVIQILTNPQLQGEGRKQERRKKLREAIFVRFDFQEMAQRSLGAHWQRRTPEEQAEFIKVFSDLLEQTYVDKIESYNNEKVIYTNERIDGPYAEVGSKLRTAKGEEFSINYKLRRVGEDWRVYDLVIENISLMNNYRSQFSRILTNSTYDELISRIKAKVPDKSGQLE